MKRDIYKALAEWKNSSRRKPLVLNGARQVGKTFALKHFGSTSYAKMVYLNFERDERLASYFDETLDPKKLLQLLGIHTGIEITPSNTLIVMDEIQNSARALNSLKYFCEEAPEYHIAAAGSLLGVKTAGEKGFPVGKVNFLHLYPLSFFEFLSAAGEEKTRRYLEELTEIAPIPELLHDRLLEWLRKYLFVGGMPEAVAEYMKSQNLAVVREIQQEILDAYEKDFSKHAPPFQMMKITTVWEQVHRQLAKENKKFIFAAIRKSARGRDYEEAIQWLCDAGLVMKSFLVETPKFPLSAYADPSAFKIFLLDVGLLGAQSHLSSKCVIDGNALFTEFKGALVENFVAQELTANHGNGLYYWTSAGIAEIDFLLEADHGIFPLEVKAGESQKKKSLLVYGKKYGSPQMLRASAMNLKQYGAICNYPLYMIALIAPLIISR